MNSTTIPTFDKTITKFSQLRKRLNKLFPGEQLFCSKEEDSIHICKAVLDMNGDPVLKVATVFCWRLYNVSLEAWNEALKHIHNDFIFPGDDAFQCYRCGCPEIDTSRHQCKNCQEPYSWKLNKDF